MAITQLKAAGSAAVAAGPLRARLTTLVGVELLVVDAAGHPAPASVVRRLTSVEVLITPSEKEWVLAVKAIGEASFAPGVMVGVSVTAPASPGSQVVRTPVDVGGRSIAPLVRVSAANGVTTVGDAFAAGPASVAEPRNVVPDTPDTSGIPHALQPVQHPGWSPISAGAASLPIPVAARRAAPLVHREWHRDGNYGFHDKRDGLVTGQGVWSMVIAGSASLLLAGRRPALGRLIALTFGTNAAARGGGPTAVLLTGGGPLRDLASALDTESVDWQDILGDSPAPWSAVLSAVQRAAQEVGTGGVITVVCDGVPVDQAALTVWTDQHPEVEIKVVACGRSRHEANPAQRPTASWDEELSAMDDFGGVVVGVREVGMDHEYAANFARALYPVSGPR